MPITLESIETVSKEEIAVSVFNILKNPDVAKKLSDYFKLQNGQQKFCPLIPGFSLSLQRSDSDTLLELRKDLGIFVIQTPEGSTLDDNFYNLASIYNSQESSVQVTAVDLRIKKSKLIKPSVWEIALQKRIPNADALVEELKESRVKTVEIYKSLSKLTSKLPTRVKLI